MSRVAFNAKAKESASDLLSGDFPSLTGQSVWLGPHEIDRNWRSPNCAALSVPSSTSPASSQCCASAANTTSARPPPIVS